MLRKILSFFGMLLFPPDCPFCERIMDFREDLVCKECLQGLPFMSGQRCKVCSKTIPDNEEYCEDCKTANHAYTKGMSVFRYEGVVSDAIIRFKYHGRRDYDKVFGFWMVRCLKDWVRENEIEVIVPVPIHKKRRRKRGYNQTELIGKIMALELGLEYNDTSIIRSKNTIPQKKLSVLERLANIRNAFSYRDNRLKNKRVLIIDDIYTTGVTVDILSICILESGADKVYFATLSQGI